MQMLTRFPRPSRNTVSNDSILAGAGSEGCPLPVPRYSLDVCASRIALTRPVNSLVVFLG